MLELAGETFEQIAVAVEPQAAGRHVQAVRHGLNIGPGIPLSDRQTQGVAAVATVRR